MSNENNEGSDTGYIFSGPVVEEKKKLVKEGIILVDNHRTGVIFSENPESPWYHSAFYSHGSILRDIEGRLIQEVALCETTDVDGDLTWSIYWKPDEGHGTFHFVVGTGKWEGITGSGKALGMLQNRVDDHIMPKYEIQWKIDKGNDGKIQSLAKEGEYTNHATSLSFHGPHVSELMRDLANGLNLEISTQAGVLMGEDPDVANPRSYATCYDRGTTVRRDGNTLGDVMLLEDTDPDGDMVWLIHVWWYGKGPGSYQFIGGTGKWEGITGEGTTLGMLRNRTDDHYLLRSEIHWRIDR
jgi:hypothetical protein